MALAAPLRAAFVPLGSEVLTHREFPQCLGQGLRSLSKEVSIRFQFGLAQQLLERHPQGVGHRLGSSIVGLSNSDGNHPVAVLVNSLPESPHLRGL
jgi:hypothetical protein